MVNQAVADGGTGGLFSRYPVTPAAIVATAESVTRSGGDLEALAGNVSQTHSRASAGVSGLIAGPMRAAPEPVKKNAMQVLRAALVGGGCVRYWATGVADHDAGVDALNREYEAAAAGNFGVSANRGKLATTENPQDAAEAFATAVDAARAAKIAELQNRYTKLQDALDKDAAAAGRMLDKGPDDEGTVRALYDAGALPIGAPVAFAKLPMAPPEDTKVPPELTGSPEEIARYVAEHPELAKVWLPILPPEALALVGTILAERARQLDKDSAPEEVAAVSRALAALGTNDEVAVEFTKSMGGVDLIQLVVTLGWQAKIRHDVEASQELARAVRAVVSTATTEMSDTDARLFADQVADAIDPSRYGPLDRAVALSFLLRDQHHGTGFLDVIGDRLEAMERGGPHKPGYGFWLSPTGAPDSGVRFLFEPDAGAESFADPMASFMSALGKNPDAALEFFSPKSDSEGVYGDVDRAEYWIRDRAWGHDDFGGILAALDAATTDQRLLDDPETAEQVARLMSSTVDYLANRTIGGDEESFKPEEVSEAGTKHLAHMLSTHMASVDHALEMQLKEGDQAGETDQLPSGGRFGDGLVDQPIFEGTELKRLVNVAVSRTEGFLEMREGVSTYQAYQMDQSIEKHGYIAPEYANADAKIEGFFANAVGDTNLEMAAEKRARVEAWLDLGKEIAGFVKVPGGNFVGMLADRAIDFTAGELADAYSTYQTPNPDDDDDVDPNNYAVAALEARKEAFAAALFDAEKIEVGQVYDALPSEDPNDPKSEPSFSRAEVELWFPDGKFPSKEHFDTMPPDAQNALRSVMRTLIDRENPDDPDDHKLVDLNEYDQNYKDMFSEYFENAEAEK